MLNVVTSRLKSLATLNFEGDFNPNPRRHSRPVGARC